MAEDTSRYDRQANVAQSELIGYVMRANKETSVVGLIASSDHLKYQ